MSLGAVLSEARQDRAEQLQEAIQTHEDVLAELRLAQEQEGACYFEIMNAKQDADAFYGWRAIADEVDRLQIAELAARQRKEKLEI